MAFENMKYSYPYAKILFSMPPPSPDFFLFFIFLLPVVSPQLLLMTPSTYCIQRQYSQKTLYHCPFLFYCLSGIFTWIPTDSYNTPRPNSSLPHKVGQLFVFLIMAPIHPNKFKCSHLIDYIT